MKISGNFYKEILNPVKVPQNPSAREEQVNEVKKDRVSISSTDIKKSQEIKSYSPENMKNEKMESRGEKIARLTREINNKTYNVSSDKIAEKLIGSHIDNFI